MAIKVCGQVLQLQDLSAGVVGLDHRLTTPALMCWSCRTSPQNHSMCLQENMEVFFYSVGRIILTITFPRN